MFVFVQVINWHQLNMFNIWNTFGIKQLTLFLVVKIFSTIVIWIK